jgi:dTDP-4-amino-4,6-dideoxygalactose transaminase
MLYSMHGQSKDALAKTQKGAWEYDILFPGYKYNMTDISASLGLAQLNRYSRILKRRREIIDMYNRELLPLGLKSLQHYGKGYSSSGHLYLLRIPGISEVERNKIISRMADAGVSCNVHYKPLPMFTAYKKLGFSIGNYPNAYKQYLNEITLPLHTHLESIDIKYICKILKSIIVTK